MSDRRRAVLEVTAFDDATASDYRLRALKLPAEQAGKRVQSEVEMVDDRDS